MDTGPPSIIVAGDASVFVGLLERFPPARYLLRFGRGLAETQRHLEALEPRLLVARLDGEGWQLTPVLRQTRALRVPILGLAPAEAEVGWKPGVDDRRLAPTPISPVVAAACELLGERRRSPRVATELSITIDGQPATATTGSAHSLFVPYDDPPDVGRAYQIAIETGPSTLTCIATVIRTDEDGQPGLVLGVPDGSARAYLDRIVRRELIRLHEQGAEEAGAPFDADVSRLLAERARALLLDGAEQVDAPEAEAEVEVEHSPHSRVTVSHEPAKAFRIPQQVMLPPEATIDAGGIEAAAAPAAETTTARGVEIDSQIESDSQVGEATAPSDEAKTTPPEASHSWQIGLGSSPTVADEGEAVTVDNLAAKVETLARSTLSREELRTHLEVHSALAGAADTLQQRQAALERRIDRLGESEVVRRELQQHLRDHGTAINILREDLSKQDRRTRDREGRLRDVLKQLRRQLEVLQTTTETHDGRFDKMAKTVARELKRARDGQAELGQQVEGLSDRMGDEAQGGLEKRDTDVDGPVLDRKVGERLEVQGALIETLRAQVENLSASSRNATLELQRVADARAAIIEELQRQGAAINLTRQELATQRAMLEGLGDVPRDDRS